MAIEQTTHVETATQDEATHLVGTITLAFISDPVMRWFFPNATDYLQRFPEFVELYGGKTFDHGTAHYIAEYAARSLWLPPGVRPDEDVMGEWFDDVFPEDRQEVAWTVLDQLETYHPSKSYWHLPVIGGDPPSSTPGTGRGS